MGYFNHADYVEMTVHFRCNLKCRHCMILESMHWLTPADHPAFEALLQEQRQEQKWRGLILTGSEVTLRSDLPKLAEAARKAGFEHVRIQTHGMKLDAPVYCRRLISAGIDEYFISVTADSASLHDAITEVPGSFERTLQGIHNLSSESGVVQMTNTVITRLSYQCLPGVTELLKDIQNLVEMDFWSYWPMQETGDPALLVSHADVQPFLRRAIRMAMDYGRAVEVKNFPHCLLGSESNVLVNDQPELRIDPRFWNEFNRNGFHQCVFRQVCGSRQCLGLNAAYTNQYGNHEDLLRPLPRTA